MKSILLLTLALTTACGTAASSGTHVHTAESTASGAFSNYHTFGFRPAGQPAAPFEVSSRSFEVERRMRPLIVAELLRKGYAEPAGDAKPDFLVAFASGYLQEATASASPAQSGGSLAAGPPITKGSIFVDAFDTSSDAQVWHGTAEAEVNADQINDQLLQTAVQRLLAPFPARIGVTSAQAP